MRTRTLRWLVIVVTLAFPVATAVDFVHLTGIAPTAAAATNTPACNDAAALAGVDRAAGVARLKALRDAGASPADTRVCAAVLIRRLAPPTIGDRVTQTFDDTVSWFSRHVAHGRSVRVATGSGAATLSGVLGFEVLLVVIGLGQFSLWRAERMAGPVRVSAVAPPQDDSSCTALAEIMRDRLSQAGIPPGTAAPGELRAVVIDAIDAGVGTSKGWLGDALKAVSGALKPSTGLTLTAQAFQGKESKKPSVTVASTVTRTGASFDVRTVEGDTYEEAAILAAYDLYLALISRESVRQRTPIWLSWTSANALRSYHDALRCDDRDDVEGAIAALASAAAEEPANVLIPIRRSQELWARFRGTVDEAAWRAGSPPGERAIEAVEWALTAVALAPRSDDALFLAGIDLSYVDDWIGAWPHLTPERRQAVAGAVERAVQTTARSAHAWSFDDVDDAGAVARQCREASIAMLQRALWNQRYWNVLSLAWPLASRREAVDRVWPWSRVRFVRRQAALALIDGTTWVRRRHQRSTTLGARRGCGGRAFGSGGWPTAMSMGSSTGTWRRRTPAR